MSTNMKGTSLSTVSVADVMSPGLLTCPPSAPLRAVAGMMVVHEVHAVVLWDGAGGSPAIVTDLDVVAAAKGVDEADAASVAGAPPTVASSDGLLDAAAVMAHTGHPHVLVVDRESGHPTGMLSTLDVAAALAGRNARAARTVRPRPARPAISTSRLDRVPVATAMHMGVFTCPPQAGLREVASIFVDRHVHCVAVAGTPGPASWKFITDLSIASAAASGADAQAADLVGEASWIGGDATLEEASDLMVRKRTAHLLVRGAHQPIGVLSTLDVIAVLAVGADDVSAAGAWRR
jgi:CBS domain-containing protein